MCIIVCIRSATHWITRYWHHIRIGVLGIEGRIADDLGVLPRTLHMMYVVEGDMLFVFLLAFDVSVRIQMTFFICWSLAAQFRARPFVGLAVGFNQLRPGALR